VKQHNSTTCDSSRADVREWLQAGAEGIGDRSYWTYTADLLFAVRPSFGQRFTYESINPAFESFAGMSSKDIQGLDVFDCLTSDDAQSVCGALRACLAEGAEVRIRHRLSFGGSQRDVETSSIPVFDPASGIVVRLVGSHRILNGAPAEGAIEDMADVRMNIAIASIQEDVQQRIASELHDSTCQHLIAASLGLMRLRSCLDETSDAGRFCNEIDASIDAALREIRALTYLLHPQDLTVDGLKATIEHYAQGFAARTSLRVATSICAAVDRLPYEHQRSVLRVTQEALTNVFRHAKATEVKIAIDAVDSNFRLTISDNGCGFAPGNTKHDRKAMSIGVGIPAMRARLEQLGGTLDIHPDPAMRNAGTVLCAVFPHLAATKKRGRRRSSTTRLRAGGGT
jgi:two-component system, NarL family, sensor kinase